MIEAIAKIAWIGVLLFWRPALIVVGIAAAMWLVL